MAERKAKEGPEIVDIDLTQKLLTIAHHSANDAGLRAVHAAARHQLHELNAGIQEQIHLLGHAPISVLPQGQPTDDGMRDVGRTQCIADSKQG